MANPLQPKIIKCLKEEFGAFVVNIVSTSKSGTMDLIACIDLQKCTQDAIGLFYGFEVMWGKDTPSELQKQKINDCIDAGGKAYFIRSVEELRNILNNNIEPTRYETKKKFTL